MTDSRNDKLTADQIAENRRKRKEESAKTLTPDEAHKQKLEAKNAEKEFEEKFSYQIAFAWIREALLNRQVNSVLQKKYDPRNLFTNVFPKTIQTLQAKVEEAKGGIPSNEDCKKSLSELKKILDAAPDKTKSELAKATAARNELGKQWDPSKLSKDYALYLAITTGLDTMEPQSYAESVKNRIANIYAEVGTQRKTFGSDVLHFEVDRFKAFYNRAEAMEAILRTNRGAAITDVKDLQLKIERLIDKKIEMDQKAKTPTPTGNKE